MVTVRLTVIVIVDISAGHHGGRDTRHGHGRRRSEHP
jgi:hypothetical protein